MFKVVLKLPDKQKPKFKMNRNVCQRAGLSRGGGGDPHMKGVGMHVGNFELFLTVKRDHVKTQTNEKTWII